MLRRTHLGSSEWGEVKGYDYSDLDNTKYLLMGMVGETNRFFAASPDRHFLTIAPTRSGKGVSYIVPNLLHYRGPAIVIDPKGENAWLTAQHRREVFGQKVYILDPWDEVNRRYGSKAGVKEKTARFNPLSVLDPASDHYADDVLYISDALIINQGKDPHWDNSARELVAGIIAYCVEKHGPAASLSLVRQILARPLPVLIAIAEEAQGFGPDSLASRKLGRFAVDSKEVAGIVSTALTQTAFLDSLALSENMSFSDFSFDDLAQTTGAATIYLVLPVDKLQTYGRWLRLMVSLGIRTVSRNTKKLPAPILFILDEFGTIGRLSAVAQAYGLMAGLQMCIWAFVQDLGQLKRDYPEDWETFIGNCEMITAFDVMDQFTARYISDLLGKTTIEVISQATAEKRQGDPNYSAMADKIFGRDLMMPEEVRRLSEKALICLSRADPLLLHRISYFKNPLFLQSVRSDPYFPNMDRMKRAARIVAEVPDYAAAVKCLEGMGYTVKKKGLLSSRLVAAKGGNETEFETETALIEWTREKL